MQKKIPSSTIEKSTPSFLQLFNKLVSLCRIFVEVQVWAILDLQIGLTCVGWRAVFEKHFFTPQALILRGEIILKVTKKKINLLLWPDFHILRHLDMPFYRILFVLVIFRKLSLFMNVRKLEVVGIETVEFFPYINQTHDFISMHFTAYI